MSRSSFVSVLLVVVLFSSFAPDHVQPFVLPFQIALTILAIVLVVPLFYQWLFKTPNLAHKPKIYHIQYVDYLGNETHRDIIPQHTQTKPGYVYAWCKLANDYRTFKLDRIKDCIDIETGEVITDISQIVESK